MSSKTCHDEDIDAELEALENELTGEQQVLISSQAMAAFRGCGPVVVG